MSFAVLSAAKQECRLVAINLVEWVGARSTLNSGDDLRSNLTVAPLWHLC